MKCLSDPERFLWTTQTKWKSQLSEIFNHIKGLAYEEKPNYEFVRNQLKGILFNQV